MLRFDIYQLTDGRTVATCQERTVTGQDPCRAIARDLVEEGAEDQPWEIWRELKRSMVGPSLHWLAASTLSESDAGFTKGWWAAHPTHGIPRPVLAAMVEHQKALAAARAPAPRKAAVRKPRRPSPRTASRPL